VQDEEDVLDILNNNPSDFFCNRTFSECGMMFCACVSIPCAASGQTSPCPVLTSLDLFAMCCWLIRQYLLQWCIESAELSCMYNDKS
jgi:hypothetical protein